MLGSRSEHTEGRRQRQMLMPGYSKSGILIERAIEISLAQPAKVPRTLTLTRHRRTAVKEPTSGPITRQSLLGFSKNPL